MRRMLDEGVEIDAVFALNDALALGALHALHAHGIDVPGEVALIGFDDVDDAKYAVPALSSVDPGRDQIARTAVELLLERIGATGDPAPFRKVVPDSRIIGRESTGDVVPGQDSRVVGVQPGGTELVQMVGETSGGRHLEQPIP
jgi:DNA-binding LacI/PurR family transcriptional regulator